MRSIGPSGWAQFILLRLGRDNSRTILSYSNIVYTVYSKSKRIANHRVVLQATGHINRSLWTCSGPADHRSDGTGQPQWKYEIILVGPYSQPDSGCERSRLWMYEREMLVTRFSFRNARLYEASVINMRTADRYGNSNGELNSLERPPHLLETRSH